MRNRYVILILAALVFLLYFPVLGNGFLTDDYAALYRLLIQKRVLFEEMVRPLIDISFYFNYLISGLHPVGYYLFNFCVHALCCFMVYRVALDLPVFSGRKHQVFAVMAALIFLFYPFHNEGVVWLAGRLSSMAALFGLMAIHFLLVKRRHLNLVLAVLCWWVGLFAYESILVLPGVALLFEWIKFRDVRRGLISFSVWVVAGVGWLGMRYLVSGQLLPAYGQSGLAGDPVWMRVFKVIGRCCLPPGENGKLMTVLFVIVMVLVGVIHFLVWARRRGGPYGQRSGLVLVWLELGFLLALLPAFAFAVSTRTAEGDRLLYFPSCVLSLLIAGVLMTLVGRRVIRMVVVGIYLLTGAILIEMNNRTWVFASRTAESGLDLLRHAPGRVVLVNVPDEWEGAYIFRNNFKEALVVNGIDTDRVRVTHVLTRLEYLRVRGKIAPVLTGDSVFVYPATRIGIHRDERVYYWNKYDWNELILGH
jgi:hypothetical protein